jgi:hypothetical protein
MEKDKTFPNPDLQFGTFSKGSFPEKIPHIQISFDFREKFPKAMQAFCCI